MTVAYESFQRTEPTEEDIEALRAKCLEDAKRYTCIKINAYDVSSAVNGFILNKDSCNTVTREVEILN